MTSLGRSVGGSVLRATPSCSVMSVMRLYLTENGTLVKSRSSWHVSRTGSHMNVVSDRNRLDSSAPAEVALPEATSRPAGTLAVYVTPGSDIATITLWARHPPPCQRRPKTDPLATAEN